MIATEKCLDAQRYFYQYLDEELHCEIPPDLKQHMDSCAKCQAEIQEFSAHMREDVEMPSTFEHMNAIIKDQGHSVESPLAIDCRFVELYIKYLMNEGADLVIPKPINDHIAECPDCKNSFIDLNSLDTAPKRNPSKKEMPLKQWLIGRRSLIRTGMAAAVLLIGFMIFESSSSALGMSFQDFCQNILKCRNLKTTVYLENEKSPIGVYYYSSALNFYLRYTGQEYDYVDLKNGIRKNNNNSTHLSPLQLQQFLSVNKNLNIIPFSDLNHLPQEIKWHQYKSESGEYDIYDLDWSGDKNYRWRYYLDKEGLPHKIEAFSSIGKEARLDMIYLVEYPTDEAIKQIVKDFD